MAEWKCEQCGCRFTRDRSGSRAIRFCSQKCYHEWRRDKGITTGQFSNGFTPWNKNLKGIHLSPNSEFKKGISARNKLPIGSVQIRHRKREVGDRAFVKTAEPNTWRLRALVVWEERYGPLPKGLLVHHIDRDTLNDEVSNLAAFSRSWHMKDHSPEIEPNRREAIRKKMIKKRCKVNLGLGL
jgi:hypothetical protein